MRTTRATAVLHAHWTTRPPGIRLAGTIGPSTYTALEQHLSDLLSRFPGRRTVYLDLTGVSALDLPGTAYLIATRNVLRLHHRELRLRMSPASKRTMGAAPCTRSTDSY